MRRTHRLLHFLRHLLRQIEGKLLVVWDGSPIHRGQAVKDFLASGAFSRLQLEQLPGYAPDLNPDEGTWKHLKYVELTNVCCRNLSELTEELRKAKERLTASVIIIDPFASTSILIYLAGRSALATLLGEDH